MRKLLHRWLVQYNPLYLLSAALCLAGMLLCSRGLAHDGSLRSELGVPAIAEAYAVVLIAGAALLTRIGQRRPAVLLALITALYQCDLTLHNEACAYLGTAGLVAGAVWLGLFVAKLHALAWAIQLRISRPAMAIAFAGALGVAVLPRLLVDLPPRAATALVSWWLFGLFASGIWGAHLRVVTSKRLLDPWSEAVLRRCLRAVWLLWSSLLVLHVAFWSLHSKVELLELWPLPFLVALFVLRREAHVWFVVASTLLLIRVQTPGNLAITALLVAIALTARALFAREPTRSGDWDHPSLASRRRLLSGALFGVYLAVWTHAFTSGAFPNHLLALDAAMGIVVVALALAKRLRITLVPLLASYVHFGIQVRILTAPETPFAWGATSVGAGFVLLIASLAASYALRHDGPPSAD